MDKKKPTKKPIYFDKHGRGICCICESWEDSTISSVQGYCKHPEINKMVFGQLALKLPDWLNIKINTRFLPMSDFSCKFWKLAKTKAT